MNRVTVRVPAKLNLGLEVLRRRDDGYHDLATIFQAIDLYDEFTVEPADELEYRGDPRIPPDIDIARRAFLEIGSERSWTGRITVRKQIPIAGGLGGGSSDAALALRLAALDDSHFDTLTRARAFGADVPFFLHGGTALGRGIGDRLEPLPTPAWWFVIVVPELRIERKTATLFSRLTPDDFSSGGRVEALAARLRSGSPELPAELPNAFARQVFSYPRAAALSDLLRDVTGRVALSGAGPSLFSWHAAADEAQQVASELRERASTPVFLARALGPGGDERALGAFLRVLKASGGRGTNGQ